MEKQNKKLIEILERAAWLLRKVSSAGILGPNSTDDCVKTAMDCKAQAEIEKQGR